MKSSTLKTFTSLHTWAGLGTGMALFIAFYAGALTVFFHELESWDSYTGVPSVTQDLGQAQQLIDQVLAVDPDAAVNFHLHLGDAHGHGHQLYWFEGLDDGTFESHGYELAENGVLRDVESNAALGEFIYRLHYTAGLPSSWGLYVLGVVCLIYGLALISGLIIFLPDFLKNLLIIRSTKNLKRFWLDTHNVVGVISLPWHFMFVWSSVLLAFGVLLLAPFQSLVFQQENLFALLAPELGLVQPPSPTGTPAALLTVTELVAKAQAQLPGLMVGELSFTHAGDLGSAVQVSGTIEGGTTLAPNAMVMLSAVTGKSLALNDPATATLGADLFNGLISLHFATFGGYPLKWVYFFLGLAGAFLFYSGNLLWVETRRKRRQPQQRRDARFLAKLNSGVCIGCMAGISTAFLMSRVAVELPNQTELTELAYFVVFFAAIGWCFVRSVAAGARDLLYLAAALSAAIPLADAIVVDMPLWRSAATGQWGLLLVNLLALIGTAAFWRMGRAVHQRSQYGDPNSVWAQPKNHPEPDRRQQVLAEDG
ncbi:MAG: PepSY-associated TM helix domain-containing protein [Pseudomonadota bacterium]